MVSRAERSLVGDWWWTIDRLLLAALAALMVSGLVFLMAGGPPVAERLGLSTFHFVHRQVLFLLPAVAIIVALSFLSLRQVRRWRLVFRVAVVGCRPRAQFGPRSRAPSLIISPASASSRPNSSSPTSW
jgi:cell division protein FtsW